MINKIKRREDPLWGVWRGIKTRLFNRNSPRYKHYGARGITISDDWMKFDNFARDMRPTYKKGLSIDRIDNNKGYCKENCRWATNIEQNNNRRNVHLLAYKGKKMNLTQWAKELNISYYALMHRYYDLEWSVDKLLSTPVRQKRTTIPEFKIL